MTDIILVRHGHVPGISPERFRGRSELQLTERGQQQAAQTAQWLARHIRPQALYTSPSKRCVDTGHAIAECCDMAAEVLPGLNDIDYGTWQGLTHDEVATKWPQAWQRWRTAPQFMRFPGGESFMTMASRAADALLFILDRHANQSVATQPVIVVTHDSIIRTILLLALNQSLSSYWRLAQEPCAINAITVEEDRCVVKLINQTAHLNP
ncbi:MAG: histidine phosphatase family protein [Steroidobacter sp.]